MATYTTYTDGATVTASGGSNAAGFPDVTVITNVFDAGRRNLAAADVVQLISIPAKTYVLKVMYEVLTEDATQTLNIGDGTDPDGYTVAGDVGTAGNTAVGAGAFATGKYYSTADTIDLEVPVGKALDTLKVRVCAVVAQFG
jgi:hypothetical protein